MNYSILDKATFIGLMVFFIMGIVSLIFDTFLGISIMIISIFFTLQEVKRAKKWY